MHDVVTDRSEASTMGLDYSRNIESFCVLHGERKLAAGTVGGQILVIDIDRFEIESEIDAHAGMIIAMDAHPEFPLICLLGVDQTASVWEYDADGAMTRLFAANLRSPTTENEHNAPPSTSVSQAIAFHPSARKLLARIANGAVAEIEFDGDGHRFTWCRAFYPDSETAYVRYLGEGDMIFVSGGAGYASVFDANDRATVKLTYRFNHEVIHAAEHVSGTDYLLPSDSRRVIRLDISGQKATVEGPAIVRDHLERVSYNKVSGRAFASSFDRCIYEVCPETCQAREVILQTPMKCRWLETLNRDPDVMIAQCRNGALYKVDLDRRAVVGALKETPNALWSGISTPDGRIMIAGDGRHILELTPSCSSREGRRHRFSGRWIDIGCDPGVYTKRIARDAATGDLLLARTDGRILRWNGTETKIAAELGSPLRDIAAAPEGRDFWVATEDGVARRLDVDGSIQAEFRSARDEPIWALAHNPSRRLLAVSEREGVLTLLDDVGLGIVTEIPNIRRTKRMRWLDQDRLLVVSISEIRQIEMERGTIGTVVPNQRNTVEDFDWSVDKRYLVIVTYAQNVTLFDLQTWTPMHSVSFDMHYPKGVTWIPPKPGGYPYEFLVWGRSGVARHYRVHDGRIIALGTAFDQLSPVDPWTGVRAYPNRPAS